MSAGDAVGTDPPLPTGPAHDEPTVGALLQRHLAVQVARLREQDERVRRDAGSAIHKMRIAVRRLRSALATYRPILRDGSTDELRAELRWLDAQLAPARDAQVIRDVLEHLLEQGPAELATGPVGTRIHTEMAARCRAGRDQALAALECERYRGLLGSLDSFAVAPPFTEEAERDARDVLPKLLGRDLRRLRRRARAAERADPGSAHQDQALHDTRKAAKRLRYAAESATPVLGQRAETLASRAKRLQELLGEYQDSVVARLTLRELDAGASLADENGITFGRLHALEQRRADQLLENLPAALERLPARRLDHWLRS